MAIQRPSLSQLISRAQDDLNARLPGADSRLRQSVLDALAKVNAGAVHGLYGYIDQLSRQILPDTATGQYLEDHASSRRVDRKPATTAAGVATATGVNGSVIPAGTVLQRPGGREYLTQGDSIIADGIATIPLAATTPGIGGVAAVGVKLAFVSPIAGVAANVVVAGAGLTGGADAETDDLLRARLLERLRQTPEGGAPHDYVRWAKEVPEVTRAWPYKGWMGAGTVGVAFMMDGRPNPIPTEDDVEAVQAYMELKAPAPGETVVFAPIPEPLNLTITGLQPNDAATRAAIEAEIDDLLFREAQPNGTILLTHIREAISTAAGERDHVLASPTANFTPPAGRIVVRGVITWPV
ncbi:baseplate J/gp47 family protein [Brevundimonas sp.]|uniref:baseplate J/gp47 family protein n=1 Tax=Brevundimonas sp. TaxID=1871086 RepID=UPI003F71F35B